MPMRTGYWVSLVSSALLALLLSGCGSTGADSLRLPDTQSRKQKLLNAAGADAQTLILAATPYRLFGLSRKRMQCRGRTLRLYIEGDGISWITRNRPSDDPTPLDPLVVRLWRLDPSPCKVYLARPCQYLKSGACRQSDWTSGRFSPRILSAYQRALNALKRRYGNRDFTLIGYSGGGAVATLLAERRHDIKRLITIAGNLDPVAWTAWHDLAPLRSSLNPASGAAALKGLSQVHLIGGSDRNMPESIYESYRRHLPKNAPIQKIVYPGVTHTHGWENAWRGYLNQSP